MKFYIASKLNNYENVRLLADKLKAAGWELTFDWTALLPRTDGVDLKSIGQKELEAVRSANVLIVLSPEGKGTHVELGAALALGKRIYLCHSDDTYFKQDERTSTFYWQPKVERLVGGIDEIAAELLSLSEDNLK